MKTRFGRLVGTSLLLLLLAQPAAVQADDFLYMTNNGTITITGYTGPDGPVTIPDTINDLRVTSIGLEVFYRDGNLTSVTIGTNVTSIGDYAFAYCINLTSVTIPNSVTTIGSSAFGSCSNLTSVTIPGNVTSSGGSSVFRNCTSVTNVTIGDGVTTIGESMFNGCTNLTSLTIGNSVTNIMVEAFYNCKSLTRLTIPNSVRNIDFGTFSYCSNLTSATIGNGVTSFNLYSFIYCPNLTAVYFKGNAPSLRGTVFGSVSQPIVYYLPGTTNWGTTFDSRPTVLWNPQAQTSDASFGVVTNQFGFTITGTADIPIVIEASRDLTSPVWVAQQSCNLTNGSLYFSDPQWRNYSARFYRFRSP